MKLRIALVQMEGVEFALVVVSEENLDRPEEKLKLHQYFEQRVFRDLPVVLVGENYLTAPRFYGLPELTEFMEGVRMEMIEWTDLEFPTASPLHS
jgi:hypothetical protein